MDIPSSAHSSRNLHICFEIPPHSPVKVNWSWRQSYQRRKWDSISGTLWRTSDVVHALVTPSWGSTITFVASDLIHIWHTVSTPNLVDGRGTPFWGHIQICGALGTQALLLCPYTAACSYIYYDYSCCTSYTTPSDTYLTERPPFHTNSVDRGKEVLCPDHKCSSLLCSSYAIISHGNPEHIKHRSTIIIITGSPCYDTL